MIQTILPTLTILTCQPNLTTLILTKNIVQSGVKAIFTFVSEFSLKKGRRPKFTFSTFTPDSNWHKPRFTPDPYLHKPMSAHIFHRAPILLVLSTILHSFWWISIALITRMDLKVTLSNSSNSTKILECKFLFKNISFVEVLAKCAGFSKFEKYFKIRIEIYKYL